jgi:AraC family L-rhamnose operon regulatory protein RhaS
VIAQSFGELAHCAAAGGRPHIVSRMAVNLNQLLIGILDAPTEQQAHENEQLVFRKRVMEMSFRDLGEGRIDLGEPWTLDRMASHCGMGVTALSKYCCVLVNTGPMEFLNQCRLERAAAQLCSRPELSITETVFINGFNSSQYFVTCFRRRYRTSLSRYSKNLRRPNASEAR